MVVAAAVAAVAAEGDELTITYPPSAPAAATPPGRARRLQRMRICVLRMGHLRRVPAGVEPPACVSVLACALMTPSAASSPSLPWPVGGGMAP